MGHGGYVNGGYVNGWSYESDRKEDGCALCGTELRIGLRLVMPTEKATHPLTLFLDKKEVHASVECAEVSEDPSISVATSMVFVNLTPGIHEITACFKKDKSPVLDHPILVRALPLVRVRWLHPMLSPVLARRHTFVLCWQVSARQDNPLWVLPLEVVERIVFYIDCD